MQEYQQELNKKIGYERRDQTIILKCDTFHQKEQQRCRKSHSTLNRRLESPIFSLPTDVGYRRS